MFDTGEMIRRNGIEHCVFGTLTFDDNHAPGTPHPAFDPKEASRRFHSLATHILDRDYFAWKRVLERGARTGRLHYHPLLVGDADYRTGVDFDAFLKGDYRTAPPALRDLWAYWGNQRKHGIAVEYGFGPRVGFEPVRTCGEVLGKYVAKYIAKHIGNRRYEDKGARMVGGSKNSSYSSRDFSWNSPRAQLWRRKIALVAKVIGYTSTGDFAKRFGPHWAYYLCGSIMGVDLVRANGGSYTYASVEQAAADGQMMPDEIPDVHGPITITSVDMVDEVPEVVSLAGHPSKIPLRSSSSVLGAPLERPPVPAAIVQAQADLDALIEAGCRRAAAEAVGPDESIHLDKPVLVNTGRQYRALRAHLRSLPDPGQPAKTQAGKVRVHQHASAGPGTAARRQSADAPLRPGAVVVGGSCSTARTTAGAAR